MTMDSDGAFQRATGRCFDKRGNKPRYTQYQHDVMSPHCGASMLEVGAGLGELAELFSDRNRLVITEADPGAVEVLRERFANLSGAQVHQLNLEHPFPDLDPVDTVLAVNVLEHFADDADLLKRLTELAVPGGNIVLWVPGYPQLYGNFDRKVGHVRRYTPATLRSAVRRAGLSAEHIRPVNLLGGLAWWAAVRLGRSGANSSLPARQVALYDRVLVPSTRTIERKLPAPFGQSILCVARVPHDGSG